MSRRRKKRQQPVIEIVEPAIPAKSPLQLEWDQKLSALAFAVNDVANVHRSQLADCDKKEEGSSFSIKALQDTLEKCKQDRVELMNRLSSERGRYRELMQRVYEIELIVNAIRGETS